MKIIVDAFGGDNAPHEVLKGCADAKREYGADIILTGDEGKILAAAQELSIDVTQFEIAHAPSVISVEGNPSTEIREKTDSSIVVGMKMVRAGEGDAFVSAGSTGALVIGGSTLVGRQKGVKRAALATVVPCDEGFYMLIDCGANAECRPDMLVQFGVMGSIYVEKVFGIERPRVGLVNIGTEDKKGTETYVEANKLLREAPLNFIGNVEARELPLRGCDVAVCDGFVGNIVLKLSEGMAAAMFKNLKQIMYKNTLTKLGASTLKKGLLEFRKTMDYTEYGGAPLLGLKAPVIKAHGSSNANAFKNAIRQAIAVCNGGVSSLIETELAKIVPATEEQAAKE